MGWSGWRDEPYKNLQEATVPVFPRWKHVKASEVCGPDVLQIGRSENYLEERKKLTEGLADLLGFTPETASETGPGLWGKVIEGRLRHFVGMIMGDLVQETDLSAIAPAPLAKHQVELKPNPACKRLRLLDGCRLKPAHLLARRHERPKPVPQDCCQFSQEFHATRLSKRL